MYVPQYDPHYNAVGLASWYGDDFHGRYTANGEIFDLNGISAAHPTLPLPSYARVTNLANGRSLIVRVNDRGPYAARPHHRPVGAGGASFGLLRSRHRHGARRICRAGAAGGLRRPRAGGNIARKRAGAAAERGQARRPRRSSRRRRRRPRQPRCWRAPAASCSPYRRRGARPAAVPSGDVVCRAARHATAPRNFSTGAASTDLERPPLSRRWTRHFRASPYRAAACACLQTLRARMTARHGCARLVTGDRRRGRGGLRGRRSLLTKRRGRAGRRACAPSAALLASACCRLAFAARQRCARVRRRA